MVGQRVTLQIIDIPSGGGILIHPADHRHQFLIRKMVTEQRRKNDIRPPFVKNDLTIIRMYPFRISFTPFGPGHRNTMRIAVYADHFQFNTPPAAVSVQHPQVIPAAATDLADPYALTAAQ